jgi:glycosyltransferase involved in cell wall biosynthesis
LPKCIGSLCRRSRREPDRRLPVPEAISIVLPAFRAEATIAGAVESVLAQSVADWQVLIVADDGTDYETVLGRAGIRDSRLKFLSSGGVGTGASNARNAGLARIETRYAALLDADDRLKPQKLERLLGALADYPIVSTAIEVADAGLRPLRMVGTGENRELDAGRHKCLNFSMDAMIGWDRERTDARFDSELPNMNDLDFLMRLFEHAATSFHLGEPLHIYVKQPQSLSNGEGMTARMIASKTTLRQRLASGYYRFAGSDAAAGLDAFLAVSIEAEKAYPAALVARPGLLFEDHIEPRLIAASTSAA